jgi:hypothetical protein
MARRVICPQCRLEFTAAQYIVHKFTHHRDDFSRMAPTDLPTLRLLPIEVPDDSGEVMEDTPTQTMDQTMDHHLLPNDNSFSNNHENASDFPLYNDPFSDDRAMTSAGLLPHNTPFAGTSDTFPLSAPSDEAMDTDPSPSRSEESSAQGPVSGRSSPLIDKDLGFEDSGLDPTSAGHPSLSERLKERFLAGYHGGGK